MRRGVKMWIAGLAGAALAIVGCRKAATEDFPKEEIEAVRVGIEAVTGEKCSHLDVFVFRADGLQEMVLHTEVRAGMESTMSTDGTVIAATMEFMTDSTDKIVCLIANCPYFIAGVSRYEILEQLVVEYEDDNPLLPVMSGSAYLHPATAPSTSSTPIKPTTSTPATATPTTPASNTTTPATATPTTPASNTTTATKAPHTTLQIKLSKLMCTVEVSCVINNMGQKYIMEEPRCYFKHANRKAELFRGKGFFPGETLEMLCWTALPNDIGVYTQHPKSLMYCYPNETNSELSFNGTSIVLECKIRNEAIKFEGILPPLSRGEKLQSSLTVNSPEDFHWNFFKDN